MPQMFGNLSIRSKLLGLVAVPLAGACLLGAAGVTGSLADRARADRERRLAEVAGLAATALHDLQEERVLTAAWVAGRSRAGQAAVAARRRRVDQAVAAYRSGVEGLVPVNPGDPALVEAVVAAGRWLDRLAVVRTEAGHDGPV